jgi:hypothetical protein
VCVCVCVCVCMFVCVYISIKYVCVYLCVYLCLFFGLWVSGPRPRATLTQPQTVHINRVTESEKSSRDVIAVLQAKVGIKACLKQPAVLAHPRQLPCLPHCFSALFCPSRIRPVHSCLFLLFSPVPLGPLACSHRAGV